MPEDDPHQHSNDIASKYVVLGAGVLALVAEWDAWVARRVDSFCFAGDDERVLERRQSMDFMFPPLARHLAPLTSEMGGAPVPVTFVNKWRLPEFSLREENGRPLALAARSQSTQIASGMLLALANLRKRGSVVPDSKQLVPLEVRRRLVQIVNSDPSQALGLCARFGESDTGNGRPGAVDDHAADWFSTLSTDELFMGLAYELARGFLLLAVYPHDSSGRRVLKFSYSSYVVPARRDNLVVWLGQQPRRISQRSRDVTDSIAWRPRSRAIKSESGRITFSTLCTMNTTTGRGGETSAACALTRIMGPDGRQMTLRLRANSAMTLEYAPTGWYLITIEGCSGFRVERKLWSVRLESGEAQRVEVRAVRTDVAAPVMVAPSLLASPGSIARNLRRGLAWFSKPLAIRVRVGDGGSYHCEFEAPPGLHVTRARLISNAEPDHVSGRPRELDIVLASSQRAHLYAPATHAAPAAAYAFFNLRPRAETIARPAVATAIFAFVALLFVAFSWNRTTGFGSKAPSDSSVLLVLVLGAPGALAAYFAQAVPSKVTNSMLYGLRLAALLPAVLALAAGAIILVGGGRTEAECALWVLVVFSGVVIFLLGAALYCAEHPPEQRSSDLDQGEDFERAYSVKEDAGEVRDSSNRPGDVIGILSAVDSAAAIRDRMLEQAGGFSRATRRMLLTQHGRLRGEFKVPPALYFDSAETTPSFPGLGTSQIKGVCSEVHDLMPHAQEHVRALEEALRKECESDASGERQ